MREISKWDEDYQTGSYSQYWGITYPSQELVAFLATMNFPPSTVAIDIGCGAGQEAIFLAQQGFTVIGVDQSEEGLKIATKRAQEKNVEVEWKQANVLNLPITDQSANLINDRGCLHVISSEYRSQYAKEMFRILKPNGYIFLRGCRDIETDHFAAITKETLDDYFSPYFDYGPILPIELSSGAPGNQLPSNLVVLKRK